jgi:predicted transcriptional regulator
MAEKTINQQLAEQVGAGDSKIVAAIFGTLTDENEAKLLLAAAPPSTAAEISEKTGIPETDIEGMVDPLFRKGLLFKSKKADGTRYYRVRNLLQMHDSTAVATDASREMLDLWKQYMVEEWTDFSRKFEEKLPNSVMRVVPVNISIDLNTQILAFDDVKNLIDGARNLAVTRCSCRTIDGACGKELEVCIQVDRAADYAIERGTGRQLSEEVRGGRAGTRRREQEGPGSRDLQLLQRLLHLLAVRQTGDGHFRGPQPLQGMGGSRRLHRV